MTDPKPPHLTILLDRIRSGDDSASGELLEIVYAELRQLANRVHGRGDGGATLQPTALVHEAWMKMDGGLDALTDRTHFFAVAARAMRQVLADHAKAQRRVKRGGGRRPVTLVDDAAPAQSADVDPVDLHDCLEQLATLNPRHAQVIEYRLFGGLSIEEIADLLGVSRRTVQLDWNMARAWLNRELSGN